MSESDVAMMGALELALDVVWDEPDFAGRPPRALAVVAEAFHLVGLMPMGPSINGLRADQMLARMEDARKHLPRRLLKADARGMVDGFRILIETGILTWDNASEAKRQRWLARGGHDQP